MKRTRLVYSGLAAVTLASLTVTLAAFAAADSDTGFVTLFDGSSLSQWKIPEGDNGHWKIVNGVIDYDAQSEAKGQKDLVTAKEYGDFTIKLDWRIKDTPYINSEIRYILPDGSYARDNEGKEISIPLPCADSGVYLRGSSKAQVNIWTWPSGSGEVYGYRLDKKMSPAVRAGVTPRTQADNPVGEWNTFEITLKGERLTVVLNGKTVIENAELPGVPKRGPICLQHHGSMRNGKWTAPPALVQFRNIKIKSLD